MGTGKKNATPVNGNAWRSRIVGTGTKPASDFLANPLNARRHPAPQREALRGILSEVGWITGVIENVRTGHVLDGHARIEEALSRGDDEPVPFIQVDLSEEEERLALSVFDPISAMADYDQEVHAQLLEQVQSSQAGVKDLLASLIEKTNADEALQREMTPEAMKLRVSEHYDYLLVVASNLQDWNRLLELVFGAESVQRRSSFGLARGIRAERLIALLDHG